MGYTFYDVVSHVKISEGSFPITENANVNWIGISSDGIPVIYLSSGVLFGLVNTCGYQWVPLLNTRTKDKTLLSCKNVLLISTEPLDNISE